MSHRHGYTWQEVLLNVDVRDEAERERKQQQDIIDEQADESFWSSVWSFGLSVAGVALGFGPLGYYVGKKLGEWGADYAHDWEDMEVSPGKFHREQAEEFEKSRDKAASDQTAGQIFSTFTDLATMYVMAGGLQEGPTDFTTFGSGGVEGGEWSVRGKGVGPQSLEGMTDIQLDELYRSGVDLTSKGMIPASEDYLPSLLSGDVSKKLGKLYATNQAINTMSGLNRLALSYKESKEEKAAN